MGKMIVKRGDIILTNLNSNGNDKSHKMQGKRPMIIISNDLCNKYSPVLLGVVLTTQGKPTLPTHVYIDKNIGLEKNSIALCEHPTPIDRCDLLHKVAECPEEVMLQIERALEIQQIAFNIDEANNLAMMIYELELEIAESSKLHNYVPQRTVSVRNGLFQQLLQYCKQYRVDYKIILKNCKSGYYNLNIGERAVV